MDYSEQIKKVAEDIKKQGYNSICFWEPARNVSGGPLILHYFIKELLENTDLKIYYVDYADGYLRQLLNDENNAHFIAYDPNADTLPVYEPVIVFCASTRVIQLKNMNPNSKVLLWHWETVPCAWEILLFFNKAKKLHDLLRRKHAMVFHDIAAWDSVSQQFSMKFEQKILPIYTPIKNDDENIEYTSKIVKKNRISIAWVGRFAVDKVNSIYNLIDNFASYESNLNKKLFLIGDGIKRKDIEAYCKNNYPGLDIEFLGVVPNEYLSNVLRRNCDILFAMGTSVLEGAVAKIPSVIVPLSQKQFNDKDFCWLFESNGYCLGPLEEQKNRLGMKFSSFKDIIDAVYSKGQKNILSQKCYQYYIDKHSNLLEITLKMLKFLSDTELTIQDIKDCIKFMPYNKIKSTQFQCHRIPIWSITTFKNEKIYKLFGLTIMILRWVGNDKIFIPFGIRPVLHRFTFTGYSFPGASKKFVGSTPSLIAMKKIMQYKQDDHRKYLLEKAKRGEKITVCLLAPRITDWLFSDIYKILESSKEFQPVVIVMPFVFQGKEEMIHLMEQTYNKLSKDGYRVIKTYSVETDTYLDLRETLNPDVLFFTMYWQPHFHPNYYISNFIDKINFLTPYCIEIIRQKGLLNFELRNVVDRCFLPSFLHKKMSEAEMDNHGDNVYITGAPKLDPFFSKTYKPVDVWKKQTTKKKRVIWAPHHSDGFKADLYQFNAFYELAEFMLEIAEKYKDKIQFAFKPHPMLKVKVDHKWGKEIADAYYQKWNDLENCQLETGEFIDLFLTSDAMIFDSISFMTEYTATNKPSLFTIGKTSRVYLNEYGEENFKILYKNTGDVKDGIIEFLENVVLKGEDRLLEARTKFIQSYILPPGKKSAAQNIVDNIYEEIFGKRNGGAE